MHTFRGQSSFKTWLFAIARNLALNELKSSYFRKILLLERVNNRDAAPSAEAAFMRNQSTAEIWEIILRLPIKLREVLILDLEHELSIHEMSSLLDVSEGTVKSRLFRARKAFEKVWKGRNKE